MPDTTRKVTLRSTRPETREVMPGFNPLLFARIDCLPYPECAVEFSSEIRAVVLPVVAHDLTRHDAQHLCRQVCARAIPGVTPGLTRGRTI